MIQIFDQWQKDDANFVETNAAKCVLECIQENSCVTITASSGVGKTATLQHVVLKMADDGYDILPITNPHDIVKFYNPNQKTLFVIDNFCGTYSINQSDLYNWESVMTHFKELIHKPLIKIIVACRIQVYKDNKFESLSIFKTNVCNLLSENFCLSQAEKNSIAEMYLETKATAIIQYSDLYECFPLLCKLNRDNTELNVTDFLKNPFSVYAAEIEQLKKKEIFEILTNQVDISYQRQLAQTNDIKHKNNALLYGCFSCDFPLIQWCCYHGVDVNQCRLDGTSLICVSSHEGDTEAVKMLLKNKADVNKCTDDKVSPLFMACQKNHVDIVKMLLEYKADVNKCRADKVSPLFLACQCNHVDIVKILLEYKADVNKCTDNKLSPVCGLSV
ncbi:unnamed protein product [Mytilus coruscus]|uniref:Novel STAND NTPase 3 domain-containing protein n=1 Tax=Mytilus coruscus TaxID=42192 RepID=A0A6J8DWM8_MYTCO|nr:unnamed protein product [Mytilus coruscus]